ncbi:leucine-rich repeat flightless-interacting protein 1 isoform X11 [Thunnus albacares]|uniref:leucine-rich repeat flightless-interacting protein 1 isoform X11 n=1 Tax=Thunnus albacares TaxID=8236 RepID=UPI001CF686CF|nr:leucine-rich repeat flightless-interacting protein 1 isoform X11 [Thunnus albacares]
MGTQGTGRKRSTKKERSTAEDDALNLIAREAEARLAAKRAARAEAREIRMKELERQQKEIFQVQKKYYGLDTKLDDRSDSKWGDIEQWMEDSERYSRPSRTHTFSDDDERMSVGSRGSVRSDYDAVYGGGGSSSHSHRKSKKKKKHKHKDRDRNGYDDEYSVISSRSSRLSDESRVSRSSRVDLTSSRLSDDSRVSRASRLDLQPLPPPLSSFQASYASSDLYSLNGLSSSRNPGSTFNGYQFYRSLSQMSQQLYRRSSLYEDSLCSGSRRVVGSSSHPLEYSSYRSSSRASSRASSARASPVDNCSSVASFLRSAASSSCLPRDLDDVTIPDFSDVSRFAPAGRDVEDRDYLEKGSRAASALTAATLTSLGGTSSRRGSGETALTVDAETSLREIKGALAEVEEKYRKAMVSNAQLDNEKNNLMYQVDTLKDSLMELEELLSESRRGYDEKVKEYEREKHAHTVLQFQFNEMKETLKQSEELLNKHGIVLGPDLNVNGDIGETVTDGTSGGDSAAQPAQDSQTSQPEGNSMLGSTEETQLRSSGEEEVDPEKHQEKNHLSSDMLCNVSAVETSSKEQPTEEQQTCLPTEEDSVGETESNDLQVDINKNPITEAKDTIVCSPESEEIVTSPEENVAGTEMLKGGDLGETSNPDLGETGTDSVDVHRADVRETSNNLAEVQENKQEEVEESNLRNTESCPQQKVTEDVMKEPDESIQDVSNTEPHQEPENAEDAENDEADEILNKSQSQGATASGKKKKRKKRGKKKGGNEEKKQQKDAKEENGNDKENGKTKKDVKLAARDNGSITEPDNDVSVTETLKESKMDEVMNDAIEEVKPTETLSHVETLQESRGDDVTGEQKEEQSLETETVDVTEAVAPTENVCLTETPNESRTDQVKDEQDMEQTSETEKVEDVESKTNPDTEASDLIDNSKGTESTDGLNKECTSSVDNSKSGDITTEGDVHTESGTVNTRGEDDEMKSERTTENPENTNCNEDTEAESHVPSNDDATVDKSERTNDTETVDNTSVSDKSPEEATETAKDDEEPGAETHQESISPSQDDDKSEKEELSEELRESEDLVEPDNSSHDEKSDDVSITKHTDAVETEKSSFETAAQAEHLDDVESQTVECADQVDESNIEVSSETEQINTSEIIKTPDSPKEATEVASLIEQDHNNEESASAEDPEHKISQNDQESEKCQQESSKDKTEDDNSPQPTQQESDEEDGDDDEGQSFDFDDMDVEAAIDMNSPKEPEQEGVEEGVEVTSDESNDGSSNEKTQDEPVDSKDEKRTVDQVDAPDKESDTKPQDDQNSSAHEETASENVENEPQENVGVADVKEEDAVVESNSAEDVNQAMSSSVEEGLDAIKHEMQGEDLPKSEDQVGGNKEPPPSGKDAKKNGKKGKAKGKEECKMS